MRYFFLIISLLLTNKFCMADIPPVSLEKVSIDSHNLDSIQRGAKFFAANCMACHTMVYLRYNTIAQQAGVTYTKMPVNVKNWPLGVTPPDLSLEANVRSVDWIYTYLHSFYVDTSRPFGVNNLLFPNTAMPGMLVPYQGKQVLVTDLKSLQTIFNHQYQWYDLLELQTPGTMTPQEFDATITDLVNFLHYAAEPYQNEQHRLGYWVIGFLLLLLVLTFYLKRAYWKDIQ